MFSKRMQQPAAFTRRCMYGRTSTVRNIDVTNIGAAWAGSLNFEQTIKAGT